MPADVRNQSGIWTAPSIWLWLGSWYPTCRVHCKQMCQSSQSGLQNFEPAPQSKGNGYLARAYLGCTVKYISRILSRSLVMLACWATISFTCDIIVPNKDAAKRNKKLQNNCTKAIELGQTTFGGLNSCTQNPLSVGRRWYVACHIAPVRTLHGYDAIKSKQWSKVAFADYMR